MGLHHLGEPEKIVIEQFLIFDIGVGAEAVGILRVFIKTIVAQQVEFAVLCPDVGFYGHGKLFVLRIGGTGSYGREFGGGIESKSHIAGDGGGGLGRQRITDRGHRGKCRLYDQGVIYFFFVRAFRPEDVFEDIRNVFLRHPLVDAGGIVGTTIAGRFACSHILDLGA